VGIENLEDGMGADLLALVKQVSFGKTKKLEPYARVLLGDKTASIEAVYWKLPQRERELLVEGTAIRAVGVVGTYKGKLQFTIDMVSKPGPRDGDLESLYRVCPTPIDEMWSKLDTLLDKAHLEAGSVGSGGFIDELREWMVQSAPTWDAFKKAPAATGMHHAYIGGLLEHSLSVARISMRLLECLPSGLIDPAILIGSAVVHDIGKVAEYELSGSVTSLGKLVGHVAIGFEMVSAKLYERGIDTGVVAAVQHCILAHHGKREWGAAVEPKTAEAYVLHIADMLDAKMWALGDTMKDGPGWHNVKTFGGDMLVSPEKALREGK